MNFFLLYFIFFLFSLKVKFEVIIDKIVSNNTNLAYMIQDF